MAFPIGPVIYSRPTTVGGGLDGIVPPRGPGSRGTQPPVTPPVTPPTTGGGTPPTPPVTPPTTPATPPVTPPATPPVVITITPVGIGAITKPGGCVAGPMGGLGGSGILTPAQQNIINNVAANAGYYGQ